MKLRLLAKLALCSALAHAVGCSANGDGTGSQTKPGGNNNTGATGTVGTSGSSGLSLDPTAGGSSSTGSGQKDPNDMRDVPVRQKTCDASGQNCTCLRLGLVGTLDSLANAKDTQPFIDWLNGNSGGTATVKMVSTKPAAIDATFLADYDILVIANVNTWTFSAEEKAAVEKWVRESGGGIVTLTGFTSTATEAASSSQLVSFAGMGYSGTTMADCTAPDTGKTLPIYYKGGSVDLRNCINLWSEPNDREASNTTPIKFMPQAAPLDKLTASLDLVGAYIGWPANAPAGSTVVATDPMSKKPMGVALEVDGKGRIFTFGDEWVVFANQWQPAGTSTNQNMDPSNMCWQPAVGTAAGFYHSTKSLYQTKQFWYNVINWVAPPNECNFTIKDPDVVVVK
ncbi:MAG TPA: hypothetical protein VEQ58_08545 [Polyangiaceae bacterium]|nr:hypothetical protein [Polyangiaceae bacterium]